MIEQRLSIRSQEIQVLDNQRGAFVDVQGDGDAVIERVELDSIVDPRLGEPVLFVEPAQAGYVALQLDWGERIGFFLEHREQGERVAGSLQGDLGLQLFHVERPSVYKLEAKGAHFGLSVDVVGLRMRRKDGWKPQTGEDTQQGNY